MRKTLGIACICVAVLFLAFVIVPVDYIHIDTIRRMPKTRMEIRKCYEVISKIAIFHHKTIEDLIGSDVRGNLNSAVARLIKDEHSYLDPDGLMWEKWIIGSEIVDAWGRPMEIRWRKDLTDKKYDNLKANIKSEIIIWSFGKNGLNDFGSGDDVFFDCTTKY